MLEQITEKLLVQVEVVVVVPVAAQQPQQAEQQILEVVAAERLVAATQEIQLAAQAAPVSSF